MPDVQTLEIHFTDGEAPQRLLVLEYFVEGRVLYAVWETAVGGPVKRGFPLHRVKHFEAQ